MSKIGIVIHREYMSRVRKKSFILLTFLMPLLFIGLMIGTFYLSSIKDDKNKKIVVIDQTGKYLPVLKKSDQYQFIASDNDFEKFRKTSDETIYATLVITDDLIKNPSAITLYSKKQVTADVQHTITGQLNEYLSDEKLGTYNIPDLKKILAESKVTVNLQTIKWDDDGNENASSSDLAMIIGVMFTFVIYIFIFAYGGMVMQGVLEEKTNRIIEVMVSSVKPFQLMMGKIIGIGLVGLTQFFLWIILFGILGFIGSFFMHTPPDTSMMSMNQSMMSMSQPIDMNVTGGVLNMISSINLFEIIVYFVIFFIGGYLIYASLFAAIGAMVNSQEDTQQFMMPITILVAFAFYTGIYSMNNPDGPLAFWASLFPLTSPIVMMMRLPFDVPLWEKLLSIGLLYLTVIILVKFSAKIYRVGILMYGKKPSIKEIIKWMKY